MIIKLKNAGVNPPHKQNDTEYIVFKNGEEITKTESWKEATDFIVANFQKLIFEDVNFSVKTKDNEYMFNSENHRVTYKIEKIAVAAKAMAA